MKVDRPGIGYRLLYGYTKWFYLKCYCRHFEVHGTENVRTDRPTLYVTNHQNNLPDGLSILFAAPRKPVFVARADFFRRPIAEKALRFLRILPIHRADHGRSAIRNDLPETLGALSDHLAHGGSCVIMAEGSSEPIRTLRTLKKGWARLYLEASEKREIDIVPVVMEYSDWDHWGPDVRVTFGQRLIPDTANDRSVAQHLNDLNKLAHHAIGSMLSNDKEIFAWHTEITRRRAWKTPYIRVTGLPFLLFTLATLWPVLWLTHQQVKKSSRTDFRSTLETGFTGLGTPLWYLLLAVISLIVAGLSAYLLLWLTLPLVLWISSRCYIAWARS